MMRVLVTRPEPDAQRTAAALRERGHDVFTAPLLRIEVIAADIGLGPFTGVLMTSANAARAIRAHPRGRELCKLPAFVVGKRSARAAQEAGFSEVAAANGGVRDLVRTVALGTPRCGPLIYLCGQDRSGDLKGELASRGVAVQCVEIYRALAAQQFPADIVLALSNGQIGGVLHFSRRTAEAYCRCGTLLPDLKVALWPIHYCLSVHVAAPLVAAGASRIIIAEHPDEESLLGLVADLPHEPRT
jgi:uroporphyrinogen-III synthase